MESDNDVPGRLVLIGVVVFILATIGSVYLAIGTSGSELRVFFLDVGQGDATLIEVPSGADVLIDGGRAGAVNRPLSDTLPFYDRSLDLLIGTHPDSDHIGGLPQVLTDYRVANIAAPARINDTDTWQAFQRASEAEKNTGANLQQLSEGDVLRLGKGVYLLTLAPPKDAVPADINDSSYVFKLLYGDTSVLFAGDISRPIEVYLTERFGEFLKADILKVAHHGSKTSSANPFLSAVSPSQAVISAGQDNRHGHPDQVVMDRLEGINASTTCTCDVGTITFVSDGREFRRVK